MYVSKVINVDIDHDGAQEAIALIACAFQGADYAALALDRDADGSIVTIGTVLATGGTTPVKSIFDMRAEPDGTVGLRVGDGDVCCEVRDDMIEHQWRSYRFDGRRFQQSGGPSAFTPAPKPNNLMLRQRRGEWGQDLRVEPGVPPVPLRQRRLADVHLPLHVARRE
jgi:hypothetical protein